MPVYLAMSPLRALPARAQSGFSLVELMVALAIGLIVSLAVMMGYLGAAQSQRGQTDISRIQETSRFAFDLFGREARNAGFRNNTVVSPNGQQAFSTDTANNTLLAGNNDATSLTLPDGTTATIINKGDTITFRYFGMDTTVAGTADGTILNCAGVGVKYGQINEDVLYIARDTSNTSFDPAGEPTLYCSTRQMPQNGAWGTPTVIPLIPGVESLQILYGEDSDGAVDPGNADGIINHYVPAGALSKSDFTLVRSILVSVAVRSPSASGFTAAQTLNHFGTDYAAGNAAPAGDTGSVFTSPTDGRLRRLYTSTFAIRNVL